MNVVEKFDVERIFRFKSDSSVIEVRNYERKYEDALAKAKKQITRNIDQRELVNLRLISCRERHHFTGKFRKRVREENHA